MGFAAVGKISDNKRNAYDFRFLRLLLRCKGSAQHSSVWTFSALNRPTATVSSMRGIWSALGFYHQAITLNTSWIRDSRQRFPKRL